MALRLALVRAPRGLHGRRVSVSVSVRSAVCAVSSPSCPRPRPRPRLGLGLGIASRAALFHSSALKQRRGLKDDDAFTALQRTPWYAMGTGAWIGLALVAGVGLALVYFFWQHRQERARCP